MQISLYLGSKANQTGLNENWKLDSGSKKFFLPYFLEPESQFQLKDLALAVLFAWNVFPKNF